MDEFVLSEPDSDSGEFDEAHEVDEEFVVSGCDAPELLELAEEAFDAISFLGRIDIHDSQTA